jgi:aryl carrier-like protein
MRPSGLPPASAAKLFYIQRAADVRWLYVAREGTMKTYESIIDLLNHEGPGLQDYVSAEQLNQLIDGTLPLASVADEYLADLAGNSLVSVETDAPSTRADLLTWIRWEIETAIEQRAEDAHDSLVQSNLDGIRAMVRAEKRLGGFIHREKIGSARRTLELGATKGAVADALGISRPTLDAWLKDSE